jgi:hypothetical protein
MVAMGTDTLRRRAERVGQTTILFGEIELAADPLAVGLQ